MMNWPMKELIWRKVRGQVSQQHTDIFFSGGFSGYLKPKHDVFQTLTKQILRVNLIRPWAWCRFAGSNIANNYPGHSGRQSENIHWVKVGGCDLFNRIFRHHCTRSCVATRPLCLLCRESGADSKKGQVRKEHREHQQSLKITSAYLLCLLTT